MSAASANGYAVTALNTVTRAGFSSTWLTAVWKSGTAEAIIGE
jgi:hypothetical protein